MITIRKTRFWEYGKIAEIYSDVFSKEYNESWTPKLALKKLKVFSRYCDVYSVFYKNKIVGFFVINPYQFISGQVASLEQFAIKGEFRNKGLGSFCLDWMEKEYARRGCKLLMLISLKSSKAFKFYKNKRYKLSKNQFIYEKELK
jgi:ribosomal protein S18 acetylase RimI-like enzyme